ncbi:phage terminase small subunit [Acinetobacter baumannii]|uniref:phage terminase small subunit n=1 Tax=Acinetobacter baumannii TaxID=470 RepID=UPI0024B63B2F|nr:phage terminase small subunit [Acinetobacter baumannii]MDI9656028.1 phage terminase small subunit [Acinetobacter baumannii]MDI9667601.1 phage terminase small subunit [Acinetobacter baumannii]MDI9808422.1 phage terminase small subunit [Acinetobacter baumannii]MDI9814145.1 phage terminase small subunit [Acinetobacter baumannii]HCQ9929939.1 terminase [Acinetobacter baumannii]
MNLARKHFQQHQAKSAAETAAEFGTMLNTNAYEQQLLQLNSDKNRLKNIQSKQNKIELKRQLLPNYKPYVEGILEVKPGVQDAVITEILVWAIDIGDYEFALDIAEYVLEHGLKLPDRFERSEACFITEDIADEFLKTLKTDVAVDITVLERLEQLIADESLAQSKRDMPDEVKAKLYLALGKTEMRFVTGEELVDLVHATRARDFLDQACKLDDKCGGRTDLNKMTKLASKLNAIFNKDESQSSEHSTQPEATNVLSNENSVVNENEQTEVTDVLLNQNGTPVVDDQGNMVPTSE